MIPLGSIMSPFYLIFTFILLTCNVNRDTNIDLLYSHSPSRIGDSWSISAKITDSFSSLPCLTMCLDRKIKPVLSIKLSFLLILAGDISINPGPKSPFKNLKIGLSNARSVKNKTAAITDLITSKNLDILGLTETWLGENETNSFLSDLTPDGFRLIHRPRCGKKGGGVAFMLSSSLKCKQFSIPTFSTFESIAVQAKLSGTTCLFLCIYRPPGQPTETFYDEINELFENITPTNAEFFIMGDFNLHLNKNSQITTKFMDILQTFDLKQWVNFPTNSFDNLLDLFITKASTHTLQSVSFCEGLADHSTILSCLNFEKPQPCKEKVQYRQINRIDISNMTDDILNSELILTPSSTLDHLCHQYNSVLSVILNKHAPLKTKFISKKGPAPWMTEEIIRAKMLRRKYERVWRKTQSAYDRSKYTAQSNLVIRMMERAKSNYMSDFVHNHSNNPKNLWKSLNKILHRCPASHLPENSSLKDLCNKFSKFFVQKIEKIRSGFTETNIHLFYTSSTSTKKLLNFKPVSMQQVQKIIMKSSNATSELDPIPTTLVKSCISVLLKPITNIVNLSISTGTVPRKFKQAYIKPLLKKPSLNKDELKNYRPVSNLSFISKILEKVILIQLQEHLSSNNMLNSFQSAYKKFHSTETALLKMHNDILMNTDNGNLTALLLLDLSAAFDTIDHTSLFKLLEKNFGITHDALSWFSSYLTDRIQIVKIQNCTSTPVKLNFGVPQGSVLGPVLFTLYTTPLSNLINTSSVQHHLYADDTQLYISLSPNNVQDQIEKLKSCATNISNWMNAMKLKLNPEKTELLIIGPKNKRSQIENLWPLNILDTSIEPVGEARNLGVLFDSDLSFRKHISSVIKSCFISIRDLKRIRKYLTLSATKTLATSLISSRMDYCNALYSGLPQKDLARLQRLQNCLARITLRSPRFSSSLPLLRDLHWLPIKYRIDYKICFLGFQSLILQQPIYLFDTLNFLPELRNLRSTGKRLLLIPKVKHNASSRAFSYTFPRLWNSLPTEMRFIPVLSTFKKELKTYLFRLAFVP